MTRAGQGSDPTTQREVRYQYIAAWIAIIGTTLFVFAFLGYFLVKLWIGDEWLLNIMQDHFAALFVVPLSAIGALCIVLVLRYTTGPIEFEAFGIKLKGSAGPVMFWILSFLAIVGGAKLLW